MSLKIKLHESATPSMQFIITSDFGKQKDVDTGREFNVYGGNTGSKSLPYNKSFTDAQELVTYARKLVGATKDKGVTITTTKAGNTDMVLKIVRETPDTIFTDIFTIIAKKQEEASADEIMQAFDGIV